MLASIKTIVALSITCLIFIFLIFILSKRKSKTQVHKLFIALCVLLVLWLAELILQATLSKPLNIDPIYFDYLVYINICLTPVIFLMLSFSFTRTKFKFKGKYLLLFIVPIVSLLILWTNNLHHLFFVNYSINMNEGIVGKYFLIHSIYTYLLFFVGLINLIIYSIRNAGFFSTQSVLFVGGSLISILINILGTFGIINMSIYVTPMSFAIAFFLYAFAIFKFDFLKVAPIALQRVVDRMSDRIYYYK